MIDGDGGLSRKARGFDSGIEPTRIGCGKNARTSSCSPNPAEPREVRSTPITKRR